MLNVEVGMTILFKILGDRCYGGNDKSVPSWVVLELL